MNMKKKSILVIFTIIFSIFLLTFVQASIKTNKNSYTTADSVYVISTIGASDNLCRSQNPPENVKLYIVEHKDSWNNGNSFDDIRTQPSEIPNSKSSNKKVWENPKAGIYDLIIDCNDDKKYDEASEPIYNVGFVISAKKGTGTIVKENSVNFFWQYDP